MKAPLFLNACGIVTALGAGKAATAQALFAGRADAFTERADLLTDRPVQVGAVADPLPGPPPAATAFDSRNNRLMLAALDEIAGEIEAAKQRYGAERIAVVLGTSTSGIAEGEIALSAFRGTGAFPPAYHYRQQETGSLATFAALALGLTGPAYTVATACTSSVKAISAAARLIRAGMVDAAIVGGADTLSKMTLRGFGALEALSATRCNPFSANRDGITIGEGAAAFLLSREPGPVRWLGSGETSDAYHTTAPEPQGAGAAAAMRLALADAGLTPADIAYINLHGTATQLNDAMESRAVAGLFEARVPCSSTKGMTGHMLGATGGAETAFLWLTLQAEFNPEGHLPPHLWDGKADPELPPLAFVAPGETRPNLATSALLSNSFGFGGSNMTIILAGHRG